MIVTVIYRLHLNHLFQRKWQKRQEHNASVFYKLYYIVLAKLFRLILNGLILIWHTSPAKRRQYVSDIIEIANRIRARDVIMEIGCGLGDIVGNVITEDDIFSIVALRF